MAFIPQTLINQVRENTDIVDVISQYVPLTKRGANYIASCPFHEDRNPSFSVSQPKQIYKCFSCGRGGNVYSFIEEIEGISFPEAFAKVAAFSQIPIDERYLQQGSKVQPAHQRLYELHDKVADFYHYYLTGTNNGASGYDYLLNRGFDEALLDTFQLGLAPDNSQVLLEYLRQNEFSDQELIDSGIFYQNDYQEWRDRFCGRLIIPLRNERGQVVAFSGRQFQAEQSPQAKYLNSPETPIFQKGELLYNLDLARPEINRTKQVLICEGYMDVMALYQAGYENVVATMGTSLTEEHLDRLTRLSREIYFIFDGDEAGQKATKRAFDLVLPRPQLVAKSVSIPQGLDPDEWLKQKGKASFDRLLEEAQSAFDFQVEYLKTHYNLHNDQELAQYIEQVTQLIAQLNSPIEQELRMKDLAEAYTVSLDLIEEQVARKRQQLNQQRRQESPGEAAPPPPPVAPAPASTSLNIRSGLAFQSEKQLLFHLIYYEEAWKFVEEMDGALVLFHDTAQRIYFALQELYYDEGLSLPLTAIVDRMTEESSRQFLNEVIWDQENLGYQEEVMVDCLKAIDKAFVQQEIEELREKVKQARQSAEYTEMNDLMMQIMRLNRKIKQ